MKHLSLLFLLALILQKPILCNESIVPLYQIQEHTSCDPQFKSIMLEIVKGRSEVKLGEEVNFSLKIVALQNSKDIVVKLDFSKGLVGNKKSKIEIPFLESGKSEIIPIVAHVSDKFIQRIGIEVSGQGKSLDGKKETSFKTGEEVALLYDNKKNSFTIETSFEAMTNSYRIWNLVSEDTLKSKGYSIVFKDQSQDKNFVQAKPFIPEVKKRKSLNHKGYFTESDKEDKLNSSMNKIVSQTGTQSNVCVTVTGSFFYADAAGVYVPLANATVEIWEDDTFSDDYLTSVTTDQNGYFSTSLCDNDGLFDSNLEIYAIAATANERIRVLNYTQPGGPYGFNSFAWSTWIVETGGGTINFGNLLISEGILNRGGAKIFDNMQKAWSASVSKGFNPSYTPVVYPFDCAGTSFYAFSGFSNPFSSCDLGTWGTGLGAIYLQGQEWLNGNEDVSYHEYGHALMHRAYSNEWYPNTSGGSHTQFPQPSGFAWSEGWATFFTQVVQNDGYYSTWADLENKNNIPYPSITGEVSEWRVAQALIDLYDTSIDGDDQGSIAYSKFISTMQSNNSSSLTGFWNQLVNSLTAWEKYYGSMSLIYNTIPVSQEPLPIPPIISSITQNPNPISSGGTGTATANLSQGSGNITYSWSYTNMPSWVSLSFSGNVAYITNGYAVAKLSEIHQATLAPAFTLTCVASNAFGSSTLSYQPYLDNSLYGYQTANNKIIVEETRLNQNYPNPFNPETTLKYQLKEKSYVSLKVYDIMGQEVATLVNTNQESGYYSVPFNGASLSSGVYICTLKTNELTTSKKIVLTK